MSLTHSMQGILILMMVIHDIGFGLLRKKISFKGRLKCNHKWLSKKLTHEGMFVGIFMYEWCGY